MTHGRRAKGRCRRFCRGNRLCYLWTLTFSAARSTRAGVVAEVRRFLERLQKRVGRLPLVWVIERGRRGTERLHVHFAVARRISHALVKRLWGLGHVWVGDPGKLPGRPGVEQLSGYLAKYVAKQYEDDQAPNGDRQLGDHRYGVTQGWTPPAWRRRFETLAEAYEWLARVYGAHDRDVQWGDPRADLVYGHWLHYPPACLWPAPSG